MTTSDSSFEAALRDFLDAQNLSASHDFEHLDRVLAYARALRSTYGGDADVITAAVLLHDLGRNDPTLRGAASAERSAEMARDLFDSVAFPFEKVACVLQAIAEHDQPELRPSTLEGRILKDADFLAGFGATGIARVAMWTGESGGTMADLEERLKVKMAARIASLEFEQSREVAAREYLFVRLFLERMHTPPTLQPVPKMPYVVIEGISGSGKTTQVSLLAEHYESEAYRPVRVREPTDWYRKVKQDLEFVQGDPEAQLRLLMTDRFLLVRDRIMAAQRDGQPVVSDRSYLSSMVYQSNGDWRSPENIAYLHALMPQPTHLFVLDLPAEEALARVEARVAATGETRGDHETPEQMRVHRDFYRALTADFPRLIILDASGQTPDALHAQIWQAVSSWRAP